MNGIDLFNELSEGDLLVIAGDEGRVHVVFPDARTGRLRICRPTMLRTTPLNTMKDRDWVGMGQSQGREHYAEHVRNIGEKSRVAIVSQSGGVDKGKLNKPNT